MELVNKSESDSGPSISIPSLPFLCSLHSHFPGLRKCCIFPSVFSFLFLGILNYLTFSTEEVYPTEPAEILCKILFLEC